MNWGNLCLVLSLLGAVSSALCFFLGAEGNGKAFSFGKRSYYLFFAFTFLATIYLLYLFLTHRFEFSYVYNYSSSDLPVLYLVSSFWAGQEGTFLLWLFFGAILGLFLTARKGAHESYALFFYLLVQIFLLIVLLKKTPFERLPISPPEGRGLNPLLQDFWMVIHPPVVFVGYSALAIPFAYGLAALIQNRYKDWLGSVSPWVSFNCFSLGAGIFIGGFWAYRVLGWGGYWGWDPVENASLVPWLTSVVLLHTILLEKNKGGLKRTNLILALLSFLLVMYGTFLTRSGVLADFSVHSFTDLGINSYLILFMLLFFFISLGLMLLRWKKLENSITEKPLLSKQSFILVGSVLILIWAFLILLGTSSPIITGLFGQASQVGTSYYTKISLPLWMILALTLSLVVILNWKKMEPGELLRKISVLLSLSVVLALLAMFHLGFLKMSYGLFTLFAFLILVGNIFYLTKRIRTKALTWANLLGHLGVGLMLIGIIASSAYSSSKKMNLSQFKARPAFGYSFTYLGTDSIAGKNFLAIEVEKNSKKLVVRPSFYYSEYNQGMMREPYIKSNLWGDLYLAPVELNQGTPGELLELKKGEIKNISGYQVRFLEFEMPSHIQADIIKVGAILEISKDRQKQKLVPAVVMGAAKQDESRRVQIFDTEDHLYLEKIDADLKAIWLRMEKDGENKTQPILVLEVSKKPLIWVLWLGTIILLLGFLISTINRFRE